MTQNYTTVVGESAATAAARAEIERLTKERDFLIQAAKDVGASFRKAMERAEKAEAERDEARAQVAAAFEVAADLFRDANHGKHIMDAILAEMEKLK